MGPTRAPGPTFDPSTMDASTRAPGPISEASMRVEGPMAAPSPITVSPVRKVMGSKTTSRPSRTEGEIHTRDGSVIVTPASICLLYTSDAADDLLCVDLGGRR